MDIEKIRQQFPALANCTWFQNGGVSLTPRVVADELSERLQELFQRGPMHIVYPDEELPRRRQSMQKLADFFSVEPDELALTRGVSEAFQNVLCGIVWKAGDEIIITADEEAALLLPVLHLRDKRGVRIVKLPLHADVESQMKALRECLSQHTRLVALSHVTTDLGFRLPVADICRAAKERGVLTFLDLAHSAGLWPISLRDLECDFAGILSYKWMYGPYAAGLLFQSANRLRDIELSFAGGRSEKWLDFENDRYELPESAGRYQYGPWAWPLVHAWAQAADWLQSIGLNAIWNRTAELTTRLKDGVESVGATVFTPGQPAFFAALVSFGVGSWSGADLAAVLRRRWKMIVKPLPHSREGLRISVPFFILEDEIDRLVDAIAELCQVKIDVKDYLIIREIQLE